MFVDHFKRISIALLHAGTFGFFLGLLLIDEDVAVTFAADHGPLSGGLCLFLMQILYEETDRLIDEADRLKRMFKAVVLAAAEGLGE